MLYSVLGGKNAFTYSGELRQDNDLTQEFVAKILNVDRTTYARYESQKIEIPTSCLGTLADFYSTSTDYLLRSNERNTAIQKVINARKK